MVYVHSEYKWRNGASYPVKAQEAGEYLHDMSEKNGGITAADVLEDARDEDSLLHPCFEWHDQKAAEKYRLLQAVKLVGDLVCVAVREESEPTYIQAFCNTEKKEYGKTATYKPVEVALSDEAERACILENAKRDAATFARKYEMLMEFSGVITEIRKVV